MEEYPMTAEGAHRHRPGGRPPAHEIEGRRQHLISVATGLFLSDGYEATSLETIAKAAGASKTTIYRNFGDKAGLFRTVLNRFVEPIWPKLSDVSIEGESPEEILTAFGYFLVSPSVVNSDGIALMRLFYRESPRFPELSRIFGEIEQTTVDVVARYLAQAAQQTSLRLSDPIWAASQYLELVWGTLMRRLLIGTIAFPDDAERQRIVESAVSLFLHGTLGPDQRSSGSDDDPA
jgi:AcrR family transcriptional regulator